MYMEVFTTKKRILRSSITAFVVAFFIVFMYGTLSEETVSEEDVLLSEEVVFEVDQDNTYVVAENTDGWTLLRSEKNGFEILFPAEPEYQFSVFETEGVEFLMNMHIYKAKTDRGVFIVAMSDFPFAPNTEELQAIADMLTTYDASSELFDKDIVEFQDRESVQFKTIDPDHKGKRLLFADGNRLFFLSALKEGRWVSDEVFNTFIQSFHAYNVE